MEKFISIEKPTNAEFLLSEREDPGLPKVQYFLHGTAAPKDAEDIRREGLRAREGRATISTDLCHALAWAKGENKHFSESTTPVDQHNPGKIFVISRPKNIQIDYGLFTEASIKGKEIHGFPLKYASARKQLAFFNPDNRREDLAKTKKEDRSFISVRPESIAIEISPSTSLETLLSGLADKSRNLEAIDIDHFANELSDIIKIENDLPTDTIQKISHSLIKTTIESVVMSRLRNLALDILAARGYKIFENEVPQERKRNPDLVKGKIAHLLQKAQNDTFDLGIPWLNDYCRNKLIVLSETMD